jgi:PAS domain-containing protein
VRRQLFERLRAKKYLQNEELTITTKMGEQRETLISTQLVELEEGFYVSSFLDVTDRRRAEALAARRRLILDAAIEHSADGIVLVDMRDFRVLVANPAISSMFDVPRERFEAFDRAHFIEHVATLSDDPDALRRIVAEGRPRKMSSSCAPFDAFSGAARPASIFRWGGCSSSNGAT